MTRRVTGSIRNDKLRRLYLAALRQGWKAETDGNGHLRITDPRTGKRFWISTTHPGGDMTRHYQNTKAKARRAGLDVGSLWEDVT